MNQGKGHWSQQTPSSDNTRDDPTHGHQQLVNTEIRLIIIFGAEIEKLYQQKLCQQKQDGELSVTHIMNSLLPNSDLKKVGKTTSPFRYDLNQISGSDKQLQEIRPDRQSA